MKQSQLHTLIRAILAFLMLATIVQPFVEANSLAGPAYFYLFLLLTTIIISFPNFTWFRFFRIPLLILTFLGTCFLYLSLPTRSNLSWPSQFLLRLSESMKLWLSGETGYFPEDLALISFLLLSILLLRLLILYKHWLMPALFCLVYLLILTAVNHAQLTQTILALVIISFITSFWQQSASLRSPKFFWQLLIVTIILIVSLGTAWYFPSMFSEAHQKIVDQTNPLRQTLREQDFYRKLRQTSNQSIGKTGFSEDSSLLGGPISQDQQLLFTATQQKGHYWRIDSKDLYTGTGWDSTNGEKVKNEAEIMIMADNYPNYLAEKLPVTIVNAAPISFLPLPYGKVTWEIGKDAFQNGSAITYSPDNSRVQIEINPNNVYKSLTYTYQEPDYQLQDLQQGRAFKGEDQDRYLQLPETLPKRVRDLSHRLTEKSSNDYDKVKAIEQYLKNKSEFTYSLTDALFLPENRDYVDFFLFDSKFGYCEHFASSMVVLLRAAGIPTRWARGFNEGTLTTMNTNGFNTYEIRSKNAHVWPEVYFENIGWVPFEPTPTFSNPQQDAIVEAASREPEIPTSSGPTDTPKESAEQSAETPTSSTQSDSSEAPQTTEETNQKSLYDSSKWIVYLLLVLLLVALFFFRKVLSWVGFSLAISLTKEPLFKKTYLSLLKRLEKIQARDSQETLQGYMLRLNTLNPNWKNALNNLTHRYETEFYGENPLKNISPSELRDFKLVAKEARRMLLKR